MNAIANPMAIKQLHDCKLPNVVASPHLGHFVTPVPKTLPQFTQTFLPHSGHFFTLSSSKAPQFPQVLISSHPLCNL